jgi:hypothetical protein
MRANVIYLVKTARGPGEHTKKVESVIVDTNHPSYSGRNGISIGEKLCLIDPGDEGQDIPMFAYVRGFYTDDLFLGDDKKFLSLSFYRKVTNLDTAHSILSKYPYTKELRDYNNWMFFTQIKRNQKDMQSIARNAMGLTNGIDKEAVAYQHALGLIQNLNVSPTARQQGLEFIPRHLHYDDFVQKWSGKIQIMKQADPYSFRGPGLYRGTIIDSNFSIANSHNPMDGIEWFNNIGFYSCDRRHRYGDESDNIVDELLLSTLDFRKKKYGIEVYAVLDRETLGEPGKLEMWDPVKDVVRVEKILGNVSFLSEFGYICTMSKYELIIGDLKMRQKYCLL